MKKTGVSLALIIFILSIFPACKTQATQDSYLRVREAFQNPPAEYRSAPLWVWNDRVTTAQIDEQLRQFKNNGIGGVFIHPRPGLITPYLSEEWLSLCRHAVLTAKELGMKAWIYDENSYPSGFAGGHVPDQMPDSVRKSLVMEKADILPESFERKPFLVLKRTADGFGDITAAVSNMAPAEGKFYIYYLAEQEPSPWYGGFTYVDLMRRDVTEKFNAVTLDAYKSAFGEEFGKAVPGVFQDEAHIGPAVGSALSYTPALFDTFQKMWDYDLRLHLPSLMEETGEWHKVRHDYFAILNYLFIGGWSRPYSEYCEANDLDFTGHYWEHDWPHPRLVQDNMAMASYAHMPGIDILMNVWDTGCGAQFGNARSVKEIRSVANQMDRKRTMSETYGAGGWDMTFFDQKRIGDWEFVLGVNFLNQHLSYMTIKGARKRDHPLSFSYHEPWWHAYGVLGDYFGRLSVAMSLGEQKNSLLILEPTTTAWMYYSPTKEGSGRLESIGQDFQDFVNQLESRQVEYDLGSEFILKEHGKISGKALVVGERAYSVVVLPPGLENIDRETLALLSDFLNQGGKVLSWVDPPGFVDGRVSSDPAGLAMTYEDGWISVQNDNRWEMLDALCPPVLDFTEIERSGGLLFHHRRVLEDAELVFLVNTSAEERAAGHFTSGKSAPSTFRSCEIWDPFSGEVKPYPSQYEDGILSVDFEIPPGGSLLLGLRKKKAEQTDFPPKTETSVPAEGDLSIRRLSPNVLTLDYCDLTLGEKTEKDLYFYDAQLRIFQHHGLERNPWDSAVQFKTNIIDKDNFADDSGFKAEYWFEAAEGVDLSTLNCVVERPDLYKVSCNGTEIRPAEGVWWLDKAFGVFDIGPMVKVGKNLISLEAKPFTIHTELEAVYILGNFDLESREKGFCLVPSGNKSLGSWKAQGMPFYADRVSYEKEFSISASGESRERFHVRLGRFSGSVVEILVNGKSAGFIASNPTELDITDKLNQGPNRVSVMVYGTLKNTLGPHHNNPALGTAWPSHFQRGAEGGYPPGSEYSLVDYGLLEDFSVILRK
jgi:hypothetical protein